MNQTETWGARIREALGVADVDTGPRQKELLDSEELAYRTRYDTDSPQRVNPWRAAAAAANMEQFRIPPPVSTYELAARLNERSPLSRVGVSAEPPSTSFAMRTVQPDGQAQYTGDPSAIEAMKASFADNAKRRVQVNHRERVALGPLFGTVE